MSVGGVRLTHGIMTSTNSRCVAKRQSSKPRESSRVQRLDRVLRVQRKITLKQKFFTFFYQKSFFKFFLWPRSLSLCPPTTPESFTHMGSAMCEIIRVHRRKSALLGYQSLARYRSLGFDQCRKRLSLSNHLHRKKLIVNIIHHYLTEIEVAAAAERAGGPL